MLVDALRSIVLMLNSMTDLLSPPAHIPFTVTGLNSNFNVQLTVGVNILVQTSWKFGGHNMRKICECEVM